MTLNEMKLAYQYFNQTYYKKFLIHILGIKIFIRILFVNYTYK